MCAVRQRNSWSRASSGCLALIAVAAARVNCTHLCAVLVLLLHSCRNRAKLAYLPVLEQLLVGCSCSEKGNFERSRAMSLRNSGAAADAWCGLLKCEPGMLALRQLLRVNCEHAQRTWGVCSSTEMPGARREERSRLFPLMPVQA